MSAEEWVPEPRDEQSIVIPCEVCGVTDWEITLSGWACSCGAEYNPDGTLMFRGDNQAKGETE